MADCTWFNQGGVPSVLLGPGNAADGGHGDNECVRIDDLVTAAKVYAGFIMDWCGVD